MSKLTATIVILTAFIVGIMVAGVSGTIHNQQNSKDSTSVKKGAKIYKCKEPTPVGLKNRPKQPYVNPTYGSRTLLHINKIYKCKV